MRDEERKQREQESQDRQALALSVERLAIPEVFLRPTDIGMDCGGIAEIIVESITACDPFLRAALYHNVLVVGGNCFEFMVYLMNGDLFLFSRVHFLMVMGNKLCQQNNNNVLTRLIVFI